MKKTVKNIFHSFMYFAACAVAVTAFTACGDDKEKDEPDPTPVTDPVTVHYEGNQVTENTAENPIKIAFEGIKGDLDMAFDLEFKNHTKNKIEATLRVEALNDFASANPQETTKNTVAFMCVLMTDGAIGGNCETTNSIDCAFSTSATMGLHMVLNNIETEGTAKVKYTLYDKNDNSKIYAETYVDFEYYYNK